MENCVKEVKIKRIEIDSYDAHSFGEIKIYFNKKSWDVRKDGLIYTDDLFLKDFKQLLKKKI